MLTLNTLRSVQQSQQNSLKPVENELDRTGTIDSEFLVLGYARIITGIRRCGKSTVMRQIMEKENKNCFYLTFDDPRLYELSLETVPFLDTLISESQASVLCFDEIQLLDKWEQYVRYKLDEGFLIVLTGSNAALLSKELGSRLTGRHIDTELFPFSYLEYTKYTKQLLGYSSFCTYLQHGGFPVSINHGSEYLLPLFDDILQRDILLRYGIRNERAFKSLALYLLSNVGSKVSANKLLSVAGVASPTSMLDYFSYLECSYLFSFIPKYDESYKIQQISPKKVYCIDVGMIFALTESSSMNRGHILENLVFNELRRKYKKIYYYDQNGECDFIVQADNHEVVMVIQVCLELTVENKQREFSGLEIAVKRFPKALPLLLTQNQEDTVLIGQRQVSILPIWKWLASFQISKE